MHVLTPNMMLWFKVKGGNLAEGTPTALLLSLPIFSQSIVLLNS